MYRANIQFKTNVFRHFQLVLSLLKTTEVSIFEIFRNRFLKKKICIHFLPVTQLKTTAISCMKSVFMTAKI